VADWALPSPLPPSLSTFTWRWLLIGYVVSSLTGIFGICLGYHRLLTHKSFKTYKWLEYTLAWAGAQGGQGGPIEWWVIGASSGVSRVLLLLKFKNDFPLLASAHSLCRLFPHLADPQGVHPPLPPPPLRHPPGPPLPLRGLLVEPHPLADRHRVLLPGLRQRQGPPGPALLPVSFGAGRGGSECDSGGVLGAGTRGCWR